MNNTQAEQKQIDELRTQVEKIVEAANDPKNAAKIKTPNYIRTSEGEVYERFYQGWKKVGILISTEQGQKLVPLGSRPPANKKEARLARQSLPYRAKGETTRS